MDSNSRLKEAYRSVNEKVVYSVSANDVLDFLFQSGVLPAAEYRDLSHARDGPEKTRLLMAFLHSWTSGSIHTVSRGHQETSILRMADERS